MNQSPPTPRDAYEARVLALEAEGMTTSDAQGVADAELVRQLFGEPVSTYSRAQAIDDGELVDVSTVAREAGIKFPVAISRAVFEDCVAWSTEDSERKRTSQDEAGRLWDVVWMLKCSLGRGGSLLRYQLRRVPREGRGRMARLVTLKAICGPGDTAEPVITVLLPDES